ncbi:hypothetical protein BJV78DRAFT_463342 [Lactifluus subvellereus]|nr:hypothetical protein BJV78DRAFT_463342 [Lactifluus subvellereus]
MADWHDYSRVIADYIALVKLVHVLGGLYIWEFVIYLDYDYSVFTRKRKLTWAFPLYLGCRLCPLVVITMQFLGSSGPSKINCQAVIDIGFVFGYLTLLFASALIILRISALWQCNKVVIAIASAAWIAEMISYIYSTIIFRGYDAGGACTIHHAEDTKISTVTTFVTDLILLVLMLIGVLRWNGEHQRDGIWWLLYMQGLGWVLAFTLAEMPPMVFVILNLNEPMNVMFLTPGLIITSLCASHMHRGLSDHGTTDESALAAVGSGERSGETRSRPLLPSFAVRSTHDGGGGAVHWGALPCHFRRNKSRTRSGDRSWGSSVVKSPGETIPTR